MLTVNVEVNGETIDHLLIHNIGRGHGNIYRYEVYRGDEEGPFATVAHNRDRPWWYLVEKVIDVMKSELSGDKEDDR